MEPVTHDLIAMLTQFVRDVGFPIAVAIWVLWKLNGKLERLTIAIYELTHAVTQAMHLPPPPPHRDHNHPPNG